MSSSTTPNKNNEKTEVENKTAMTETERKKPDGTEEVERKKEVSTEKEQERPAGTA